MFPSFFVNWSSALLQSFVMNHILWQKCPICHWISLRSKGKDWIRLMKCSERGCDKNQTINESHFQGADGTYKIETRLADGQVFSSLIIIISVISVDRQVIFSVAVQRKEQGSFCPPHKYCPQLLYALLRTESLAFVIMITI